MNTLAVGAHFDDVEIGCGGAIAKHVHNGDNVTVLVVTDSAYTDHQINHTRSKKTALREGKAAADILGYQLVCGNLPTREIGFSPELVDLIEGVIHDHSIDMLYTHWDHDVHQDHQAIGKASLTAGRKLYRLLMYRSNLYQSSMPFNENFFVDISNFIDLKMRSVAAHETEVRKFGPEWLNFWKQEAMTNGIRCGTKYAEVFQIVKFLT